MTVELSSCRISNNKMPTEHELEYQPLQRLPTFIRPGRAHHYNPRSKHTNTVRSVIKFVALGGLLVVAALASVVEQQRNPASEILSVPTISPTPTLALQHLETNCELIQTEPYPLKVCITDDINPN